MCVFVLACANGEIAPFVGHNAFLRWRALQDRRFRRPRRRAEQDLVREQRLRGLRHGAAPHDARLHRALGDVQQRRVHGGCLAHRRRLS